MASRSIAQEQFNELVQESIEELDMDEVDAVDFAVQQLLAQGVNLINIVPDIRVVRGEDAITSFSKKYESILSGNFDLLCMDAVVEDMRAAIFFAQNGVNYKLYAGKCKIDALILAFAKSESNDDLIVQHCLECLLNLYNGYPDLMTEDTMDWLTGILSTGTDEMRYLKLSLLAVGCAVHENNKQLLYSKPSLMEALGNIIDSKYYDLLHPVLTIICHLTRDDDIRVEVSKVHERAVAIAQSHLCQLYDMIDEPLHLEVKVLILKALSALTVTNQLAMDIFTHDGSLSMMESVLKDFYTDKVIMTSTMKFLVSLGGNDDVKCAMKPLIPLIIHAINNLIGTPSVLQFGFLLISAVALRNKENSMALIECNALDILVQGMMIHEKSIKVRRNGCLALRNMASSSQFLKPFEELGVAETINEIMAADEGKALTDVAKGVLVALGAPVDLTERWTGASGDILSANEIAASNRATNDSEN